MHDSNTVGITGNAQVVGPTNVSAKLDLVIAPHLRPVVDELKLLLTFNEWAIAAANVESVAEGTQHSRLPVRSVSLETRPTRRKQVAKVIVRNTHIFGWSLPLVWLVRGWVVLEPAETKVSQQ